jgi:hypothetical protein
MTDCKESLIKQQNEYNVGDFVQVEREISLKPHTLNYYKYNGIIVKKLQKSIEERTIYWFKDDYNYLVSVPDFKGDYVWIADENVKGKLNLPMEYKLSMIGQFGDWWHTEHDSIYHCLLIEAIK